MSQTHKRSSARLLSVCWVCQVYRRLCFCQKFKEAQSFIMAENSEQPQVQSAGDSNNIPSNLTLVEQPWRKEPEIDLTRQRFLAERRSIIPDPEHGIYPYKGLELSRADIEWLLTTHRSGSFIGPVDWNDINQRDREGIDL